MQNAGPPVAAWHCVHARWAWENNIAKKAIGARGVGQVSKSKRFCACGLCGLCVLVGREVGAGETSSGGEWHGLCGCPIVPGPVRAVGCLNTLRAFPGLFLFDES